MCTPSVAQQLAPPADRLPLDHSADAAWRPTITAGLRSRVIRLAMGHERSSTTLDLYSHRTDNSSRILDALNDPDEVPDDGDPDGGPALVCAPG